jgi:hypothetical protein
MSPGARWARVEEARINAGHTQMTVCAKLGAHINSWLKARNAQSTGPFLARIEGYYGLPVGPVSPPGRPKGLHARKVKAEPARDDGGSDVIAALVAIMDREGIGTSDDHILFRVGVLSGRLQASKR